MTKFFVTLAALGSLAACSRVPKLRPRLILQGEEVGDEFWLTAPCVAVVKITSANLQGPREPFFQGAPKTLQLVKFVANVENVIKGDLPGKEIAFFFFAKADQNPTYYLDPGKRYIVSLRNEGGVWRSFADATQLKIWVRSGSHNQKDLPLELGPEATIAYIQLTPGADCDLHDFGMALGWPRYGDPRYVNQRLKELELSPNRELRDSACLETATMFWHRPKCLEQVLDSPDARDRRAAAKDLKEDGANLSARLRINPSSLFSKHCTDYMTQMFEVYAEDVRPEVRKAACGYLRSFAPQQADEHCK
ncbi:MAG: hypothetical protein ABSB88_09855 [Bryobacteraceae bacterium]